MNPPNFQNIANQLTDPYFEAIAEFMAGTYLATHARLYIISSDKPKDRRLRIYALWSVERDIVFIDPKLNDLWMPLFKIRRDLEKRVYELIQSDQMVIDWKKRAQEESQKEMDELFGRKKNKKNSQ